MSDYISSEAAIKRFTFATLDCLGMEPTIRASDVVLALQSIPAADVRPVVRGEWVYDIEPDMFRCSVCNGFAPRNDYPFCHWCGADMRGERE